MELKLWNSHEVVLGDTDTLHTSDENEGADDKVSRNTIRVEGTKEGGENSAMDVLRDYSIDAPFQESYGRKTA